MKFDCSDPAGRPASNGLPETEPNRVPKPNRRPEPEAGAKQEAEAKPEAGAKPEKSFILHIITF